MPRTRSSAVATARRWNRLAMERSDAALGANLTPAAAVDPARARAESEAVPGRDNSRKWRSEMRMNALLPALSVAAVHAVPGAALAQYAAPPPFPICDPTGPSGAFAYGVPAADNPLWCTAPRAAFGMQPLPTPGFGMVPPPPPVAPPPPAW